MNSKEILMYASTSAPLHTHACEGSPEDPPQLNEQIPPAPTKRLSADGRKSAQAPRSFVCAPPLHSL